VIIFKLKLLHKKFEVTIVLTFFDVMFLLVIIDLIQTLAMQQLSSFWYLPVCIPVLKSDNANGLFYFREPCQPSQPLTEAASVTCTISRQRGDDGQVIVTWAIYQLTASQAVLATEDFTEYTGQVVFEAGERSKVGWCFVLYQCVHVMFYIIYNINRHDIASNLSDLND